MDINAHKKLIKEYYEKYKKIGYVECPAFGDEKVYFNRDGFRHLIRKGKKLREIEDQIERLRLLKYAPEMIGGSKNFTDYNKNKPMYFTSIPNVPFGDGGDPSPSGEVKIKETHGKMVA